MTQNQTTELEHLLYHLTSSMALLSLLTWKIWASITLVQLVMRVRQETVCIVQSASFRQYSPKDTIITCYSKMKFYQKEQHELGSLLKKHNYHYTRQGLNHQRLCVPWFCLHGMTRTETRTSRKSCEQFVGVKKFMGHGKRVQWGCSSGSEVTKSSNNSGCSDDCTTLRTY